MDPLVGLSTATRHAWEDLAATSVERNPCSEPSIAAIAAPTLEDGFDAALLSVRTGDRLVLALPVHPFRRFRRVPVRGVATWRHAHFTSGVPLVAPGASHDAWAAVLEWMDRARVPWLVLDTVHDGGPAVAALDDVLSERHRRAYRYDSYERAMVRRRDEPTYLEGRVSGSRRKKLRRHRRQMAELLGDEVCTAEVLSQGTDLDAALEEFLRLEASGWKGERGTALASRSGDAAFFDRSCASLHEAGRLQLWRFGTPDRTAAMACAVIAGDTVFHLKVAYDEEFAHFSPGVQLDLDLLDEFHRDPRFEWLDSCTGADNEGMNQFYPDRMSMTTLLVAPSDLRGRVASSLTPRMARTFRGVRRRGYRLLRRTPPPDHGIAA